MVLRSSFVHGCISVVRSGFDSLTDTLTVISIAPALVGFTDSLVGCEWGIGLYACPMATSKAPYTLVSITGCKRLVADAMLSKLQQKMRVETGLSHYGRGRGIGEEEGEVS